MTFVELREIPEGIGPYALAAISGDFVFVSMQLPVDYKTGRLVEGDFEDQLRQVLSNVREVLESIQLDITNILKITLYTTELYEMKKIDAVLEEFFGQHRPACSVIGVAFLPNGAGVAVEAIASKEG